MKIALNKMHFPVTTLGFGRRVGIWTQGCSIRCPQCINRDTWDARPDAEVEVAQALDACAGWLARADGLTLSGGEPFDQPEAVGALLAGVRGLLPDGADVLVYTGYSLDTVRERHPALVAEVDVLISEPYRPEAGQTLGLRGSDNQRVTLLTARARGRYPADVDRRAWDGRRSLDCVVEGADLWTAGIPRPGEMERLKAALKLAGYDCATSADRPPGQPRTLA